MPNNTGKKILSFLKVLLLTVLCIGVSILIVWPLWKFATSAPAVFTTIVLILIAAMIIFLAVKFVMKTPLIVTIQFILNFLFTAAGIFFVVKMLLNQYRLFALFVLLATVAVIIVLNLILNRIKNGKRKEKR